MLAGLPERFAPMIMAIEHSGLEVSADIIKTKLMDMCSEVGTVSGSDSAFLAKNTLFEKWQPQENLSIWRNVKVKRKIIKCYKCKLTGHYKNQCPNSIISNRMQCF